MGFVFWDSAVENDWFFSFFIHVLVFDGVYFLGFCTVTVRHKITAIHSSRRRVLTRDISVSLQSNRAHQYSGS